MKTITSIHADAFGSDLYYRHVVDGHICGGRHYDPADTLSVELRAQRQKALDWFIADIGPGWVLSGRIVIDRQPNAILMDPEAETPTYRDLLIGTASVVHTATGATRTHSRTSEEMPAPMRDGFLALIAAREADLNTTKAEDFDTQEERDAEPTLWAKIKDWWMTAYK